MPNGKEDSYFPESLAEASMERPEHLRLTPDYALYRPQGPASFSQCVEELLTVLAWAVRAKVPRLLTDLRQLQPLSGGSTFERLQLGERGAAVAATSGIAVAVLAFEPFLDPERFGETVAVNRGLNVRTFTDEVAALLWLVGPNAIRPVTDSPRTRLRWLVPNDAAFIQELVNQPSWLSNIGDRQVHDLAGAEGYIRNGPVASYAKHGFGLWCVERKEDGVPVGICGLLQRDYLDAPDIGYAFLERFQGQGYASETTAAAMAHAREVLGVRRVYATVVPSNAGSIRVLEKLGMHLERTMVAPGETKEVALYQVG